MNVIDVKTTGVKMKINVDVENVLIQEGYEIVRIGTPRQKEMYLSIGYPHKILEAKKNEYVDGYRIVVKKILKPAELIFCLQFLDSSFMRADLSRVSKNAEMFIEKLDGRYKYKNNTYDLILVRAATGTTIWLGHWNDGVYHE